MVVTGIDILAKKVNQNLLQILTFGCKSWKEIKSEIKKIEKSYVN